MPTAETEIRLSTWRSGSTQAERLAAAILRLESYADVEPQAPIGGPDDRADILCSRGGYAYVAAVYFPPTEQPHSDVVTKFEHDLQGPIRRGRNAFVFFTNQRLTLTQRTALKKRALDKGIECEIYDVERIAGALDEPTGYGLRAAYLGIPMSADEQIAYFARREHLADTAIERNTAELRRVAEMTARLESHSREVAHTMRTIASASDKTSELAPLRLVDPLSVGELSVEPGLQPLSFSLGVELILMVHRMVCFDLPSRLIGRFRTEDVVVALPGGPPRPLPPPEDVAPSLRALCEWWNSEISGAKGDRAKIATIARFHQKFLSIHPFLDGNGRTARALLLQQCIDTFGRADMSRLDRGVAYQGALNSADRGELEPLAELIGPIIQA